MGDSSMRGDSKALKERELVEAQIIKDQLENLQRDDRKKRALWADHYMIN